VGHLEEDLISKRELLDATGISYGQLYRWKRKNLIPEDWFIRKSTFTGQETFFPRALILERIGKIKGMKDERSLDELAGVFSPVPADLTLGVDEFAGRNIVTEMALDAALEVLAPSGRLSFTQMLWIFILDRALRSGEIGLEEGRGLLRFLSGSEEAASGRPSEVLCARKLGVAIWLLAMPPGAALLEDGAKICVRESVHECIEALKLVLVGGGVTDGR